MGDDSKHDEAVFPTIHSTTSTGPSEKPSDPSPGPETPKSDCQPTHTFADEDEINTVAHPSIHSTQSPVHFVLGHFFFAMSLISLIVFATFSAVTWFTVLQDARSMSYRVLPNATGVSLCIYHNEWTLLTIAAAIGINTRPYPTVGPGCMRAIHFMEGRRLRWGHF